MLSFRNFLIETFLLLENRLEFLKSKFTSFDTSHDPDAEHKEPHAIIDHFANADPHPTKGNTQWVLNQYRKGHIRQADSGRVRETLGNFERHKSRLQNRDINSYRHIDDVDTAVQPHIGALSNKELKKKAKDDGADLIYKSPKMIVHKLKTKEAACQYGSNTKWCTAAKGHNYFDHYNKQGPLYVIHHADGSKHQFHFETGSFADAEDRMHDPEKLIQKHPELTKVKEFRAKHFAFSPDADENELHSWIKNGDSTLLRNMSNHPKLNSSHVGAILDDPHINHEVKGLYLKHHMASDEHIENALKHEDPSFPRSAIENPNLKLHHLELGLQHSDSYVAEVAAGHRRMTPELLHKALDHSDPYVQKAAIYNANSDVSHVDKAMKSSHATVRATAIHSHAATSKHVDAAINDPSYSVRHKAVQHEKLSEQGIHNALDGTDEEIKQAVLGHSKFNASHQEKVVNSNDPRLLRDYVKYGVSIEPDFLEKIHKHDDEGVRAEIAEHHYTPESVKKSYLTDKSSVVRAKSLYNYRDATREDLHRGLDDANEQVRLAAVSHSNIDADHLTKALKDESVSVRSEAMDHRDKLTSEHLETAINDKYSYIRKRAARHWQANENVLKKAYSDIDPEVAEMAAKHENNTTETLDHLMNSNQPNNVKYYALKNPNVAKEHLDKAVTSDDADLLYGAVRNPELHKDHITKLIQNKNSPVWVHDYLYDQKNFDTDHIDQMVNSEKFSPKSKLRALIHPKATSDHLHKVLESDDEDFRRNVLYHDKADDSHIDKLMNDSSAYNRQSVVESPKSKKHHIEHIMNNDPLDYLRTYARDMHERRSADNPDF